MNEEAESMFDDIAGDYEAAFSHDPGLHRAIDEVLNVLQPRSSILDVGCGTGRPLCHRFAQGGHNVTGIDISQRMLDIAKKQVAGDFTRVDMSEYVPKQKFSAVFAMFSLFNSTRLQVRSMVFKFHDWLNPGGRLVVATIPSNFLFEDVTLYDGEWVDQKPMYFMGHDFRGSASTVKGWKDLFAEADFVVEKEFFDQICPADPTAHQKTVEHYFFIVRREEAAGNQPIP